MVIFGSGTPTSKLVTDAFPVFVASEARMLLAAIVLVPLMVASSERGVGPLLAGIDRGDWLRLGAISVFGMFLFSVLMLYGMKEVSGAIGGVVMATTPAVTAAGSVLFLRERLDRASAIAIALAVGGLVAVNAGTTGDGSSDNVLLGSALVFGAVCGEAAYTLFGKRLTADLEPITVAAMAAVGASLLFAPLAIVQVGEVGSGPELTDWLALAWWGLGTMALGSVLWYSGVSRVSGTTASAFMGLMPVSALVLSYLMLGESFQLIHLGGMALVLAGLAVMVESQRRA